MPRKKLSEADKVFNQILHFQSKMQYHAEQVESYANLIILASDRYKELTKPGFKFYKETPSKKQKVNPDQQGLQINSPSLIQTD